MVREAKVSDAPALASIYAFHVTHGTATFDTEAKPAEAFAQQISMHGARGWPFLVAEVDGVVAGYAYVAAFRDRPAYRLTCENSIYIADAMRGRRIGSTLLSALLDASASAGFRQMIAVIGGGEPASVALHERHGFRLAGRMVSVGRKHGRWLDTVYMQRAIGIGDGAPPDDENR